MCLYLSLKSLSEKEIICSINIAEFEIGIYLNWFLAGTKIANRVLGAVSLIVVFGAMTPFNEIISAFSWLRVPKGFIEILSFAYRYIFVLLEEAMVIYHAQKNRLGYLTLRKGLTSFGTLTGCLVIKAFDHSHNITVAMVCRGYDGNIKRLRHNPPVQSS